MKSKQVQEFKETEIGKIPVDWEVDEIGNILSLLKDGSHNPPKRVANGIKFIAGASDIENNQINFNNCTYITKEDYDKIHPRWEVKENDILLTIVGTIGKTAIVKKADLPFSLQRSIAVLRTNQKVNYRFLFYWCDSLKFKQLIYAFVNPTGQPGIYLGSISKFLIPIPTIEEQLRIADVFNNLDKKISNLQNQNRILEQTAQAIFQSWFVDFDGVTEFEDSELGTIPKGWKIELFGDIYNVTDFTANGSFAGLKENVSYSYTPDHAILVRQVDFNNGWNDDYVYVNKHAYNFLKKSSLEPNDIMVSNIGANYGTVFRVPDLGQPMTGAPNVLIIKTEESNNEFVYFYLLSRIGQNAINSIVTGSAVPKFNKTDFRNHQFVYPDLKTILNFHEIIFPLIQLITRNEKQIKSLQKARDLLLPKLMSGEIRV